MLLHFGLLRGWARDSTPRASRTSVADRRDLGVIGALVARDGHRPLAATWPLVEDEDAVGEREGLVDVVGHQQDGGPVPLPERE